MSGGPLEIASELVARVADRPWALGLSILVLVISFTVIVAQAVMFFSPVFEADWSVGPYRVQIREQTEVHRLCREKGATFTEGLLYGCYVRAERLILTVNDASVLAHEFKHALEPDWRH